MTVARLLLVYCLVAFAVTSVDATVNDEVRLGKEGPSSSAVSTRETLLSPDEIRRAKEKGLLPAAGNMAIITTDGEHCTVGPG